MFTKKYFEISFIHKRKILLLWCWCQCALLACKRLMDFFHGSKLCWVANKKFFLPSFFSTTLTNFLWWGILKFTWPLFFWPGNSVCCKVCQIGKFNNYQHIESVNFKISRRFYQVSWPVILSWINLLETLNLIKKFQNKVLSKRYTDSYLRKSH